MKTLITLKSFSDLPPGAGIVRSATTRIMPQSSLQPPPESGQDLPAQPDESGESFRESLRRRATAPFYDVIPYNRWG
jgi:hypothetical protein